MVKSWHIVTCFVLQFFCTDTARILAIYPVPSISHQVAFRPITLELVKRGHEVVVITADPMFPKGQAPENLTEIDVHDISYSTWTTFMATARGNKGDLISQMKVGIDVIYRTVDMQLQVEEIRDLIKGKEKFDLLMTEACIRPMLAFSHIYKVPLIQVSSFGAIFSNYDVMGAPKHPFLYPQSTNQRLYNLTLFEKLYELYNNFMLDKIMNDEEDMEDEMLRRHFGPDIPSVKELQNNVHMLFLNVHPVWEGNRPVPPSVIHTGGLPQKPNKDLPAVSFSFFE